MVNKRELFYVILLLAVGTLILIFFPIIDLEFSQCVYHYQVWADWVLRLAIVPALLTAFLFSVRLTALSIIGNLKKGAEIKRPWHMAAGILSVLFLPFFTFWWVMTYLQQSMGIVGWIMVIVIIVFSVIGYYLGSRNKGEKEIRIIQSRSLTGLLIFYVSIAVTMILSSLCGRVPYATLVSVGSTDAFSTWFRPNNTGLLSELSGGSVSYGCFPSIEIAMAAATASVNYLQDGTRRRRRNLIIAFSFLYSLFVSALSVMNGLCYVTDAVFTMMLSAVVVALIGFLLHAIHPEYYGTMYEWVPGEE